MTGEPEVFGSPASAHWDPSPIHFWQNHLPWVLPAHSTKGSSWVHGPLSAAPSFLLLLKYLPWASEENPDMPALRWEAHRSFLFSVLLETLCQSLPSWGVPEFWLLGASAHMRGCYSFTLTPFSFRFSFPTPFLKASTSTVLYLEPCLALWYKSVFVLMK